MRCFLQQTGTKLRPVQRGVNHAANINSPDSAGAGILPLLPTKDKGTPFLPRTTCFPRSSPVILSS